MLGKQGLSIFLSETAHHIANLFPVFRTVIADHLHIIKANAPILDFFMEKRYAQKSEFQSSDRSRSGDNAAAIDVPAREYTKRRR